MSTIQPYSGPFTSALRKHLLRRTQIGIPYQTYQSQKDLSLSELLNSILTVRDLPSLPTYDAFSGDSNVQDGESWVDAPYPNNNSSEARRFRNHSLQNWTTKYLMDETLGIYPKMMVFWHNHFVIADNNDPKYEFHYFKTLHQYALGNFKDFTKAIVIEPAMLKYLNGNQNTAQSPNENFARELLELFTIGKGPIVSEGDYTNYTEQDIVAIAKALTGWRDVGFNSTSISQISSAFRSNYHDNSDKQLSHRFDHKVIPNLGAEEYKSIVDIIFEKKEVAYFICRKLYRYFIDSEITEAVEESVIAPLADLFYDSGYEILPVLQALLNSSAFLDENKLGGIIKNPLEYILPLMYHSFTPVSNTANTNRQTYRYLGILSGQLDMEFYNPPSVSGWKAYYQEPGWSKNWITTTTLKDRFRVAELYLKSNSNFNRSIGANLIDALANFERPESPLELVKEFVEWLLPMPLDDTQLHNLKESFIPGLPDYEWTIEYLAYVEDPADEKLKIALNNKLKQLVFNIVTLPDYQII